MRSFVRAVKEDFSETGRERKDPLSFQRRSIYNTTVHRLKYERTESFNQGRFWQFLEDERKNQKKAILVCLWLGSFLGCGDKSLKKIEEEQEVVNSSFKVFIWMLLLDSLCQIKGKSFTYSYDIIELISFVPQQIPAKSLTETEASHSFSDRCYISPTGSCIISTVWYAYIVTRILCYSGLQWPTVCWLPESTVVCKLCKDVMAH